MQFSEEIVVNVPRAPDSAQRKDPPGEAGPSWDRVREWTRSLGGGQSPESALGALAGETALTGEGPLTAEPGLADDGALAGDAVLCADTDVWALTALTAEAALTVSPGVRADDVALAGLADGLVVAAGAVFVLTLTASRVRSSFPSAKAAPIPPAATTAAARLPVTIQVRFFMVSSSVSRTLSAIW